MASFKRFRKKVFKNISKKIFHTKVYLFGKTNCAKDTVRCKYHSSCCTENLKIILKYIDKLFKDANIKYWLDYGTLLGAVREHNLIEHDTDLDVGILIEDKNKLLELANVIKNDGFLFEKDLKMDFYRICLSETNSLHVDIFLWLKGKNGMLYREEYMKKDDKKGKDFPEYLILKLENAEIDGNFYPVPKNPEEFCEFRFGNTWNVKIKNQE